MSVVIKPNQVTSVEDYLTEERSRDVKHELIDGYLYAMAGVSANDERICVNVLRKFGNHLENSPYIL
ncbi:Uma2 family endonuclease [Methylocucumis oryzae]|uniref:Putative restriction endonuclease domain-containing protein n=1 Tax=Methylocucumis oryzae TaxID=1632867 RepID=A0A0F3IH81_9GAMM|nr:Uma2 family endonuclease [Methylocucumis oryzae]KJV06047.1 hypothetical protein VZ94_13865 [Methylocucumis oryzae]